MDALAEHSALNQVVQSGNLDNANQRFGGGLTGNGLVQHFIKPFGRTSLTEAGAATAIPALLGHGLHPEFAAGTLAGQAGLYGALLGVDHLLGNANPLDQFAQRFAPDSPPPSIMAGNASLPSFRQPVPGGSGPALNPGPTAGPSGAPQAPVSPSPVSPPSPGPQGQPTAPVGVPASPTPAPVPSPAPVGPRPDASAAPSPQLALAMARLMAGKAKPQEPASGMPTAPAGGPGPVVAPETPTNPQAALARLLLAQRGQDDGGPVPSSPEASPTPTPLALARIMVRGQDGEGAQVARTSDGAPYRYDGDRNNIVVSHGDHTVVRSSKHVRDVNAYATATHRNLQVRQAHFDAVTPLAEGTHDTRVLTDLHHVLNQRTQSWGGAQEHIRQAVEEDMTHTDWDKRATIANTLLSPKMRGTWERMPAKSQEPAPEAPGKPEKAPAPSVAPTTAPQAETAPAASPAGSRAEDALDALMRAVTGAKLSEEAPAAAPQTPALAPRPSRAAIMAKAGSRLKASSHDSLNSRIVAAMQGLGAKPSDPVRLSAVRDALSDVPRATLDAHLLRIIQGRHKGMSLSQISDNKAIDAKERAAAFSPAGHPHHLIRYGNAF